MHAAFRVHNVHMTKLLIKRRSAWTLHCTSACGLWRRVKQTSCRKLYIATTARESRGLNKHLVVNSATTARESRGLNKQFQLVVNSA